MFDGTKARGAVVDLRACFKVIHNRVCAADGFLWECEYSPKAEGTYDMLYYETKDSKNVLASRVTFGVHDAVYNVKPP